MNGFTALHSCQENDFLHGSKLRHHLALGPDFALATQVFYEKNVISTTRRSLPPVHARKFVREMVFIPTIPWNIETVYWTFLLRLADKHHGFVGLQYIDIRLQQLHARCNEYDYKCDLQYGVDAWCSWDFPEYKEGGIAFKCAGKISICPREFDTRGYSGGFAYVEHTGHQSLSCEDIEETCREFNDFIQMSISFKGKIPGEQEGSDRDFLENPKYFENVEWAQERLRYLRSSSQQEYRKRLNRSLA